MTDRLRPQWTNMHRAKDYQSNKRGGGIRPRKGLDDRAPLTGQVPAPVGRDSVAELWSGEQNPPSAVFRHTPERRQMTDLTQAN